MPHHSPVSTPPVVHVGSLWVLGFPSTCAEKSGLEGHPPSPSPCSHGRPVCSGPASARPLTVCCLAPAPGLRRRFASASAAHLCQDLAEHRLSPALVSRVLTWHVALYCVLGVFAVPAGPRFTSAQPPGGRAGVPQVGDLPRATRWLWGRGSRRRPSCGLSG